jgi:hypothetical protein
VRVWRREGAHLRGEGRKLQGGHTSHEGVHQLEEGTLVGEGQVRSIGAEGCK